MNREEVLAWIGKHPVFFLGTTEGMQPRVRAMRCLRADDDGLFFSTEIHKDMYTQLVDNPAVELCFYNDEDGVQIRVSGRVELLNEDGVRREVLERAPFLQSLVDERGLGVLAPCLVRNAKAYVWTEEVEGADKETIDL